VTGYWTRTLLAVPVYDGPGELLGVLEAVNKKGGRFDADDEALLRALAHQYGSSLGRYSL
jgi:GAF domain-containing protein